MKRNEMTYVFHIILMNIKKPQNVEIITIWKLTGTLHTQKKKYNLSGLP